jgi:hypothetical protein
LLDEVGRAENGEGIDLATVHEFTQDEASFDGFPDTDIIGDEDAWHWEAQGHQERDELIDARLERKLSGGAERPCTTAEGKAHGIRKQSCFRLHGDSGIRWKVEAGGLDRAVFQPGI